MNDVHDFFAVGIASVFIYTGIPTIWVVSVMIDDPEARYTTSLIGAFVVAGIIAFVSYFFEHAAGAVIGGILAGACGISSTIHFHNEGENNFGVTVGYAIISFIVGSILVYATEKRDEMEKQKEYEAQEAERQRQQSLADWENGILSQFHAIESDSSFDSSIFEIPAEKMDSYAFSKYADVISMRDRVQNGDGEHWEFWNATLDNHIKNLKVIIKECLGKNAGLQELRKAQHYLRCINVMRPDEQVREAIRTVDGIREAVRTPVHFLNFYGYGKAEDLPQADEQYKVRIDQLKNKIEKVINFSTSGSGIIDCINEALDVHYYEYAAEIMWYYANLKPFDANQFESACRNYEYCADFYVIEIKTKERIHIIPLEELLARFYSGLQLGGADMAGTQMDYARKWVGYKLDFHFSEECILLASGLAWMGLPKYELKLLQMLVTSSVQLEADVQERLRFLEEFGTNDIPVYSVIDSSYFNYDGASLEWQPKDYSAFFRKLIITNRKISYSLALEKWTKTIPLEKKKTLSNKELLHTFREMVNDYDGEIQCFMQDAKEINLANVFWNDAILFHFTSERSRGVTLLFSCEKYGRTLNLTIITLFTPDPEIDLNDMQKYCTAVKGNMYVSAFKEAILQTIDRVVHEDNTVYGVEQETSPAENNRKIFE